MTAREVELYRAGLIDVVQNRPRLTDALKISGEPDLMIAYVQGQLMGRKLLRGTKYDQRRKSA